MAQAYIGGGRTTGRSPYSSLAKAPLLRRGSTGAAVRGLQRTLAKLGFYRGPIDGIFGPRTEAAVRAFQRSVGLRPDGIVGPRTRIALSQGAYVRRVTTRPQPRPAPRPTPQPTNLLSRLRQGVSNVLNRLRQSIQQTTRRTVMTPFGFMPEDLYRTITGNFSDVSLPRRPATAGDVARLFVTMAAPMASAGVPRALRWAVPRVSPQLAIQAGRQAPRMAAAGSQALVAMSRAAQPQARALLAARGVNPQLSAAALRTIPQERAIVPLRQGPAQITPAAGATTGMTTATTVGRAVRPAPQMPSQPSAISQAAAPGLPSVIQRGSRSLAQIMPSVQAGARTAAQAASQTTAQRLGTLSRLGQIARRYGPLIGGAVAAAPVIASLLAGDEQQQPQQPQQPRRPAGGGGGEGGGGAGGDIPLFPDAGAMGGYAGLPMPGDIEGWVEDIAAIVDQILGEPPDIQAYFQQALQQIFQLAEQLRQTLVAQANPQLAQALENLRAQALADIQRLQADAIQRGLGRSGILLGAEQQVRQQALSEQHRLMAEHLANIQNALQQFLASATGNLLQQAIGAQLDIATQWPQRRAQMIMDLLQQRLQQTAVTPAQYAEITGLIPPGLPGAGTPTFDARMAMANLELERQRLAMGGGGRGGGVAGAAMEAMLGAIQDVIDTEGLAAAEGYINSVSEDTIRATKIPREMWLSIARAYAQQRAAR